MEASARANHRRAAKSPWRVIVKIAVSTALMVFLVRRISMTELLALLRELDVGVFAVAVGCFFISNVIGSYQWHELLRASGINLTFVQTFRFYFVGLFFNNFLPANIGGDAVKVYDVTRVGSSVYQVIAVTLLDRVLGIFSLCLLATVSAVFLITTQGASPYGYYMVVFVACMVPALGFYFFKPLGNLLRRIVLRIRPLSIDSRVTSILDHLSPFKGRRFLVFRLVGVSLLIQALRVTTHILVGVSLGVPVGVIIACQFFVFVPLLSLAMIPPITINGLGVREGLGIILLASAGLEQADAFTLEFLTYVVSVAVSLLGLFFFLSRRGAPSSGTSALVPGPREDA
jgi:uncharacterized protein (TIRG00374 family)